MNACSRLIVSALLAAASAGASALTTLTYSWTDIACGIHARDGSTTPQPCTPGDPSFTAVLQPGEYLFVTANLNYVYHDDGLALPPGGLYGFQMDSRGEVIRFFDHEAAGLFFLSNPCNDRGCEQRPYWFGGFSGPPAIVFGDNAVPDDLTGRMSFSATAGIAGNWPAPAERTAAFGVLVERTFSGITAVPEPSTSALLLAGLLAVAIAAKRRRQPSA